MAWGKGGIITSAPLFLSLWYNARVSDELRAFIPEKLVDVGGTDIVYTKHGGNVVITVRANSSEPVYFYLTQDGIPVDLTNGYCKLNLRAGLAGTLSVVLCPRPHGNQAHHQYHYQSLHTHPCPAYARLVVRRATVEFWIGVVYYRGTNLSNCVNSLCSFSL